MPPSFKPIRQLRVSEQVVEQLKRSITLGYFKSGEKLPSERDLAREFQVSRVAIRESLRALQISGFIITRQGAHGGTYVTDLTFDHLVDAFVDLFLADKISTPEMYELRLLLEPEVARLAALRITPEYAQRLKEAADIEELPVTSLSEEVERKQTVHFILAEMCGNRFLEVLMRSLLGLTKKVIEAVPDLAYAHPAGMHCSVVEVVLAGNAEAAEVAMKKHVIEFGEILIKMEETYRQKKSLKSI
jgi:DNA-binding FadR family transcriptional regulator